MTEPQSNAPQEHNAHEQANDLIGWETLREAVAGQPQAAPSPAVERALLAKIRVREAERLAPPPSWWTWVWGVAVALLVSVVLWAALKPGIVVSWTVQAERPTTFRLLRASSATGDFRRLHTFEAAQAPRRYRYVDVYVWPGRTYVYRIEAERSARPDDQRTLVVPGYLALPGQLAVLATGLLVGYGATIFAHRKRPFSLPRSTRL
ncbi:MAG: hypothetical protein ACP5HM_05630 [Anaerolineae bacterium]